MCSTINNLKHTTHLRTQSKHNTVKESTYKKLLFESLCLTVPDHFIPRLLLLIYHFWKPSHFCFESVSSSECVWRLVKMVNLFDFHLWLFVVDVRFPFFMFDFVMLHVWLLTQYKVYVLVPMLVHVVSMQCSRHMEHSCESNDRHSEMESNKSKMENYKIKLNNQIWNPGPRGRLKRAES